VSCDTNGRLAENGFDGLRHGSRVDCQNPRFSCWSWAGQRLFRMSCVVGEPKCPSSSWLWGCATAASQNSG
jgi:hypothetical protein